MSADSLERRLFLVERGLSLIDIRTLENRAGAVAQALREITIAGENGLNNMHGFHIPGSSGTTISGRVLGCDGQPFSAASTTVNLIKGGTTVSSVSTSTGLFSFTSLLADTYYDLQAVPDATKRFSNTTLSSVFCRPANWDVSLAALNSGDTACSIGCGFMPTTLKLSVTLSDVYAHHLVLTNEVLTWDTSVLAWLTVKPWGVATKDAACGAASGTGQVYIAVDRSMRLYLVIPACPDFVGGYNIKIDAGTSPPWPSPLSAGGFTLPTNWASVDTGSATISDCLSFSASYGAGTTAHPGQGGGAFNITSSAATLTT